MQDDLPAGCLIFLSWLHQRNFKMQALTIPNCRDSFLMFLSLHYPTPIFQRSKHFPSRLFKLHAFMHVVPVINSNQILHFGVYLIQTSSVFGTRKLITKCPVKKKKKEREEERPHLASSRVVRKISSRLII